MASAAQAVIIPFVAHNPAVAPTPKQPTIRIIQELIAARYKLTYPELVGHQSRARLRWPRHLAIWLCCRLTPHSTGTIGRLFDKRDHTTICSSFAKVQNRLREEAVWAEITEILAVLAAGGWQIPANMV